MMKMIYATKYFCQNLLTAGLVVAGDDQPLNEQFYTKTMNYFTKPGDVRRAFKMYLTNIGIEEKPYYLKNGFRLKSEFKLSVIGLSATELAQTYPLDRK